MGKILIIRGGAIGDFILTLPVFAALREHLPDNHFEVLGYPAIASLAVAGGLADRMQTIESRAMAGFFAHRGRLDDDLKDYFSEFDLIVSFLYDPDGIFEANVRRCSPAQFIAGPHRPDDAGDVHATDAFLKALERLAVFEPDPVPKLKFEPATRSTELNALDVPWLAVHPGSSSESKNWSERNWFELLPRLIDSTRFNLLLIGGESEGDRTERLARALPSNRVQTVRNRPLPEVGSLLGQCAAYLGHDTGISHLAAAVGLEGILLWGPTNEKVWRPRSTRFEVLRDPGGLAALDVETVLNACQRRWPATPV